MIRVENNVEVFEVDGKDLPVSDDTEIVVRSHWNRNDLVVLEIKGKRFSVAARDIATAINNAVNTARY